MITAEDARKLTEGSMKYKGLWFKIKLNWMCGRINKLIENTAERGDTSIEIQTSSDTAIKYFPLIAHLYENYGYIVAYHRSGILQIRWDDYIPTSNYVYHWNYYTQQEEELENESTSKTSGNRKNKGAIIYRGKK